MNFTPFYPFMVKRADKPLATDPPIDYAMDQKTAEEVALNCADKLRGVWFQVVTVDDNKVVSSVRLPKD